MEICAQIGMLGHCIRSSKWGKMVRQEGNGLNCQFNSLSDEEWSNLFDTLEEWERYLAQLDSKSLRCEDEHFRP